MKKHLPIIVALGAPIVFILGLVIYVALSSPINPQYDFVYTHDNRYNNTLYVDENGTLQLDEIKLQDLIDKKYNDIYSERDVSIWYYSIEEDRGKKITLSEAQELTLDSSKTSPDGFSIEYRYSYNDVAHLFGARNQRGQYIYKDSRSKKINIDGYYVEVLGWVIK